MKQQWICWDESVATLSLEDLSALGEQMRESDVNECKAAGWRNPLSAVLEAVLWSGNRLWVVTEQDNVLMLAGLASCEHITTDHLLQPWMVATSHATPRTLVAAGKEILRRMEEYRVAPDGQRRVFWNCVWSKAGASHRYLEHLGFRIDRDPSLMCTCDKTGEHFYPFET